MRLVQLPQVKEPVTTGVTITKWLLSEGATVAEGDLLARGESETALVEIRAAAGGKLQKILAPAGKTVAWDAPLAEIEETTRMKDEGERMKTSEATKTKSEKATAPTPLPVAPSSPIPTTPTVPMTPTTPITPIVPITRITPIPPKAAGTVTPILMPQAGQSMEEGTIVAWRVAVGDAIQVGQVIFEVETDKATIEVEADHAGRLARIVVAQDETVPVKTPLAYLADSDADVDAYLAAQGGAGSAEASQQVGQAFQPASGAAGTVGQAFQPASGAAGTVGQAFQPASSAEKRRLESLRHLTESGRVKASPAARKTAAERSLDLTAVGAGSGPGGRILSTDVAKAAQMPRAPSARASAAAQTPSAAGGGPTRRRMSGMRRAIARNLTTSKQTIPHFYIKATFDAEPLMAFYRAQKERFKCSLNDVIVMASAKAIREFPGFRSRIEGDELVEFPTANIGVAVGMDDGLVVPVIVGAERLTFEQLAAETRRIVEAARSGKIEGMGQGVFTITNLGMFGVEEFSAIINPPEAAILAVSAVREAVIVRDGTMRAGRVMTVTLSCDHRVIDGMLAAKFLARFQEIVADLAKSE